LLTKSVTTKSGLQSRTRLIQKFDKNKNPKKIKFKKPFEGIVDDWYEEVSIIEDISGIEVFEWCELFEDLSMTNKWNKSVQIQLLKRLVKDPIITDRGLKESWKEIRRQLITAVYPEERLGFYKKQLRTTYQINFATITEYYDELKDLVKIIRELTQKKNSEIEEMLDEAFYEGLGNKTHAKVFDQEAMTAIQCYDYLKSIETRAIARAESRQSTTRRDNSTYNNNTSNESRNDNYSKKTNINETNKPKNDKYCKLHLNGNHSTEECTKYDPDYYKKKRAETEEPSKNLLITEKISRPKKTAISGTVNGQMKEFTIDSGSAKNFIKRDNFLIFEH
jgi:hypothetical protein